MYIEKKPGEEWSIYFGLNNTEQLVKKEDRGVLTDEGIVIIFPDIHHTSMFIPSHAINRLVTRKSTQLEDYVDAWWVKDEIRAREEIDMATEYKARRLEIEG